jgi:UDP-GlcNAc:undecaprenyl-phosphate/decaprenyl-phosphate GlcNAc-1-phosphate transferase
LHPLHIGAILGGLAIAACLLSAVITRCMRGAATKFGLIDSPGERKIHTRVIPRGGGVGIFVGVWLPLWICILIAVTVLPRISGLPEWLVNLLPPMSGRLGHIGWIFAATLIIAGMGLIDDLKPISGRARMLIMALVAAGLVLLKVEHITLFFENDWFTGFVTVAWIVGITCAFMVIDNMDGLAAGVGAIVAAMLLVVALQTGQFFLAAVLALLVGSLGGFLIFNFPPASIFMGDCGSTFLGFFIAVLTADFTYFDSAAMPSHALYPILVPILILALPIFDIASVMWIRLREGRSIFEADKRHFSHRLVALGMTHRQAVLTIYLVTAGIGLGATILYQTTITGAIITLAQAAVFFTVIVVLERAGLGKEPRQ